MLVGQEYFGSTFFLPKTVSMISTYHMYATFMYAHPCQWDHKKLYNYYISVPAPDAEAPEETLGDCSVCLEPILSRPDLSGLGPPEKEAIALLRSVGEPRSYCLAPCNHKFHAVRIFLFLRCVLISNVTVDASAGVSGALDDDQDYLPCVPKTAPTSLTMHCTFIVIVIHTAICAMNLTSGCVHRPDPPNFTFPTQHRLLRIGLCIRTSRSSAFPDHAMDNLQPANARLNMQINNTATLLQSRK